MKPCKNVLLSSKSCYRTGSFQNDLLLKREFSHRKRSLQKINFKSILQIGLNMCPASKSLRTVIPTSTRKFSLRVMTKILFYFYSFSFTTFAAWVLWLMLVVYTNYSYLEGVRCVSAFPSICGAWTEASPTMENQCKLLGLITICVPFIWVDNSWCVSNLLCRY